MGNMEKTSGELASPNEKSWVALYPKFTCKPAAFICSTASLLPGDLTATKRRCTCRQNDRVINNCSHLDLVSLDMPL